MRVLVVEDDKQLAAALRRGLEGEGYAVDVALTGTDGEWVSMGIVSDGSYGIPEGLISGFPCTCEAGEYEIVQGIELDAFSRERIDASVLELTEERDTVKEQGLI